MLLLLGLLILLYIKSCFGLSAAFAVEAWLALQLLPNQVGLAPVVWTPWSSLCAGIEKSSNIFPAQLRSSLAATWVCFWLRSFS